MVNIKLKSIIKCPECGFEKEETMPTDSCWYFYECTSCEACLSPRAGDCCVFCSYGSVKCPPKQAERPRNVGLWAMAGAVLLKAKEKGPASAEPGFVRRSKWLGGLSIFPVIGAVLLPGISCPACWPAYAALLGLMGLGFIDYTLYLFPLMLLCLVVALFSLGFRARGRRGFGPLVLGSAAALIILTTKFIFAWKAATYGAVLLLVAASVWNLRPRRKAGGTACPDCVPAAAPPNKTGTQITPKEVSHEC